MTTGPLGEARIAADAPGSPRRRSWWLIGGVATAALIVVQQLALAIARGTAIDAIARVALALWLSFLLLFGVRWLWRRLTYRVGVRLFLSYLLIGLAPFPLLGTLGLVAGYILVGQYGALGFSQRLDRTTEAMAASCEQAVRALEMNDPRAAQAALAELGVGGAGKELPLDWILVDGTHEWRSRDLAGLTAPRWAVNGAWHGPVLIGAAPYAAVVERRGERLAGLLLPLDIPHARALSASGWYDVRFISSRSLATLRTKQDKEGGVTVVIGEGRGASGSGIRLGGEEVPVEQVEPGWATSRFEGADRLHRVTVAWMRLFESPRSWQDGSELKGWALLAIVKVSVGGAADAFFASPQPLGREVSAVLLLTGAVFGTIYLLAVGLAALMIVSITRSTARLTRGACEVGHGNFAHRIPVRRRDQLGDLAVAFNAMTESVQGMLTQVAEKERLAREMELAREIQESLLPQREFTHDGLAVHAYFRPAAEVGGDYFDLFPLDRGRLILTVGDVAGHGLSTGLLMAMVKSAVAALVQEGHRGRDLLDRLNVLVRQHPARHRMVTLATLEIDVAAHTLEVTNTGHPPAYVVSPDGTLEEILLGTLPLGGPWLTEPASRRVVFPPNSKLVVYSDGLVEAVNRDGEPFGYEALRQLFERSARLPADQFLAAILAELDRFTAGTPVADDLTVLVVESVLPV